jgi:hypothetical protein
MLLIAGDRATGKTTELIRLATVPHDYKYIVCPNRRMGDYVAGMARDMGIDNMLNPVTMDELPFHKRFIGHVLVDEPVMMLERLIGAPIDAMTVCADQCDWRAK